MIRHIILHFILIILLLVTVNVSGQFEDNCCARLVGGSITTENLPREAIDSNFESDVATTFDEVFQTQGLGDGTILSDCPIVIDFFGTQQSTLNPLLDLFYSKVLNRYKMLEYVFLHTLKYDENEVYSLKTILLDRQRRVPVVDIPYVPKWKEGDNWKEIVQEQAKDFMPLDDKIFAYELMPLSADLMPSREKIYTGEQMEISVDNIMHGILVPQSWQRVFIQLKYGKLLNGIPHPDKEKMWRFEVGEGSINLQYQAPEKCEDVEEVVTIFNSCEISAKPSNEGGFFGDEKTKIGEITFDVICMDAELVIEGDGVVVSGHLSGKWFWKSMIPLRFSNKDTIKGKGSGPWTANLKYSDLGSFDGKGSSGYNVFGELKKREQGPPLFYYSIEYKMMPWQIIFAMQKAKYMVKYVYDFVPQDIPKGVRWELKGFAHDCKVSGNGFFEEPLSVMSFNMEMCCPDNDPPCHNVSSFIPAMGNSFNIPEELEPMEWKDNSEKTYEAIINDIQWNVKHTLHFKK